MGVENRSFASVLNIGRGNPSKVIDSSPTIVLDDECLIERDFSCFLIGKFKDINALPNLYLILSNEGFENVKLTHLGGLLQPACDSFVCDERIIWISIEGLPIKAMTHNTFAKTVSSWGELTNVEDSESTTISYKRLCMKVKSNVTINDTIKLVGDEKENNSENFVNDFELDNQKELDHVSETSFKHENNMVYNQASKCSEQHLYFDDPFGFTPDLGKENVKEVNSARVSQPKEDLNGNNEGVASHFSGIKGVSYIKLGGSLWDVMDELIKVGYVLGYNMDRCMKNIKAIIGSQGDRQEFLGHMIDTWDGECVLLGDFNEMHSIKERHGTVFKANGANAFNNFITMTGLVDLPLEGYPLTWSHKLASKMSKLDRYWKIINSDVVVVVLQFFSSGILPPGCNSSFIALIPKMQEAKIIESLHLSFKNMVNAGLYKGLPFDASDLKINLHKSKLMGIGIPHEDALSAAESIGFSTFSAPFNFLGVKVGSLMSKLLSSLPLYHMSIFKCPMGVLKLLELIGRNFFNGVSNSDRRLALIGWENIMASKKNGGLDVSRALNNSHNIPKRSSPWLDIIREVRRLSHKEVGKDVARVREYRGVACGLKIAMRMREEYIGELKALGDCDGAVETVRFMEGLQVDDMDRYDRMLLLMKEMEAKAHEKSREGAGHGKREGAGRLVEDYGKRGLFVGFSLFVSPPCLLWVDTAVVVGLVGGVASFQ
ncbi:RNA-directed DNA polymerase, eukaryota [Tanacetum coccineum]|uniref:RNA-directed DNA polymerase, eukaryota n=1 Tax=Tanacetum coccineum TaxID=301880 RepID=A0ABQ5DEY6_9ASTR